MLDLLRKQPGVRVPELAAMLEVSEGTIRNDLNALAAEGKLRRVHGGAVLITPDPFLNNSFYHRHEQNIAKKLSIAREAAMLVNDGDSILLDASSTAYYFAQALSKRQNLRIITNGFEIASELAQNPTNIVILIGGVVNHLSSSVTGILSERIIEEFHSQKTFLSCSGFNFKRGMTEVHLDEAQLKRKMIESTHHLYALIDSSKFGKEDLTSFAPPEKIQRIFVDSGLATQWRVQMEQIGIAFTICEPE